MNPPLGVTVTLFRSLGLARDKPRLPEPPPIPGPPVTVTGNWPVRVAVTGGRSSKLVLVAGLMSDENRVAGRCP